MSRLNRTKDNRLPLPTRSEAAFERVLESFGAPASVPKLDAGDESMDEFVDRIFAQSASFLERDRYASIADAHAFHTKIAGVSFEGRQDLVAGLQPGFQLDLERQPENPHDANAIAVRYGNLQIGFLNKAMAKHLAAAIDAGSRYRARIESLTGGPSAGRSDAKFRGVNIYVEREGSFDGSGAKPDVRSRAGAERQEIRRALIGDREPRDAQRDVLTRIDAGKNTLAVMGTGRGKSFCFQYAAAHRALDGEQKTLVLYPLRALANDQFEALKRRLDGFGLRILRANGAISAEERAELMNALALGTWDIVLSTPEFLQFHRDAFAGRSAPAFVVVDESHHLFESKHRAAYGALGQTIASLGNPQILALTATAGDAAFRHIVEQLKIAAWVIDPTVRENLHVVDARGKRDKPQKLTYLRDLFEEGGRGIVYCNSRSESAAVAQGLRASFGNEVMFYHAGMPSADRAQVESLFREGALRIVVATSAFGEGIDLPDVRQVVLYHLNFDFTEFNQQAGRAGRDGNDAYIHLLFGDQDRRLNEFIIDREAPTIYVLRELFKGMRGMARDGELRASYVDIARTLDLDKANERTVSIALKIFEDEGLVESGIDDEGRYVRFVPVDGKVDLAKNDRFAEGEAEREDFARFCELVLTASASALERIINRPIYPEREALLR
ncbi:MAG: DEAD/DEAH box helicase [Candidatus Eremiobacteraeota bacterium]|nr:DEAD/DEAH box helicase [Candidatus Eremiobacteraeota bacterium]